MGNDSAESSGNRKSVRFVVADEESDSDLSELSEEALTKLVESDQDE